MSSTISSLSLQAHSSSPQPPPPPPPSSSNNRSTTIDDCSSSSKHHQSSSPYSSSSLFSSITFPDIFPFSSIDFIPHHFSSSLPSSSSSISIHRLSMLTMLIFLSIIFTSNQCTALPVDSIIDTTTDNSLISTMPPSNIETRQHSKINTDTRIEESFKKMLFSMTGPNRVYLDKLNDDEAALYRTSGKLPSRTAKLIEQILKNPYFDFQQQEQQSNRNQKLKNRSNWDPDHRIFPPFN